MSLEKPLVHTHAKPLYEYGAEKRREIGNTTDLTLFRFIEENPGCSIYELAGAIEWNAGKVGESIKRLTAQRKIKDRNVRRKGRMLREIFPIDFKYPHYDEIEIPKNLLESDSSWKNEAYIYALDEITIGISGEPVEEWEKKVEKKDVVSLNQHSDKIRLIIPKEFCDEYNLASSEVSQTIIGNKILIIKEGTILKPIV